MALINCPECKKEVSDSASTCPFCGYSVAWHVKKEKSKLKINAFLEYIRSKKFIIRQCCKIAFVVSFLICLIVSICMYSHFDSKQTKAERIYDNITQAILDNDSTISSHSFLERAQQAKQAKEMQKNKNLTFPIAFFVLIAVESLIYVVYKKCYAATPYHPSAKTNDDWERLRSIQGEKVGRCNICGKNNQSLIYLEFEDQFGSGQGNLCYDCFLRKYNKSTNANTNAKKWAEEIKTLNTEEIKERIKDDYNWTEEYRMFCLEELKNRL